MHNLLLAISTLAMSQAGNLIRLCETHALTIAFYRLILAFLIIIPFCLPSILRKRGLYTPKVLGVVSLMSLFFAGHFIFWITAIQMTKVANAAIFLSLSPIFISLGSHFLLKEKINPALYPAIVCGIIGTSIISIDDLHFSWSYFWGDLSSLLCTILFSFYFIAGKKLREIQQYSLVMPLIYLFAALICLIVALLVKAPLVQLSSSTWWALTAVAIIPTVFGHGTLMYIVKFFKASTLSIVVLVEPVLAGIVAYWLFNESLTLYTYAGYVVIIMGLMPILYKQIKRSNI